jgi:hypothetical protein
MNKAVILAILLVIAMGVVALIGAKMFPISETKIPLNATLNLTCTWEICGVVKDPCISTMCLTHYECWNETKCLNTT